MQRPMLQPCSGALVVIGCRTIRSSVPCRISDFSLPMSRPRALRSCGRATGECQTSCGMSTGGPAGIWGRTGGDWSAEREGVGQVSGRGLRDERREGGCMEAKAPWTLKVRTILALAMDDERGRDLQSKAIRRRLRELAGQAYARELGAELTKLEADFARWRSGEIDPVELSDRIHRFHNGRGRGLSLFSDPR